MANFNRVVLVGRLTRDPEVRTFAGGGRVARLGFVVNNRKKDSAGQWQDDPCFLDVDAFNSQYGAKLADTVEKHASKGTQLLIEGRLVMDSWDDKATGQKRTKVKIVADSIQLLDKSDGRPQAAQPIGGTTVDIVDPVSQGHADEQIPF